MNQKNNTVRCTNCGAEIDVNQALAQQMESALRHEYDQKALARDAELQEQSRELNSIKEALLREKTEMESKLAAEIKAKVSEESRRLEKEIQEKYDKENSAGLEALKKELNEKSEQLRELNKTKIELESLRREKDEIREMTILEKEKEMNDKILEIALKTEKAVAERVRNENDTQLELLRRELEEKSTQLRELNKAKAEIETLRREKDGLREQIAFEKEQELNEVLRKEKILIREQADKEHEMRMLEKEKQLEDQKRLIEEMQRKANQGSMQLQGEVQELALEATLKQLFPFDQIEEVAKGVRGADVVQTVRNRIGEACGKILYESKRTKAFSNEWINKLKADAIAEKADVCVIVTEAMPDGIDTIGNKDGVWICSVNLYKGLVIVLRDSLMKISDAFASQTNKGEKMQMLYDYLMGNEFRMQVSAIIEGFTELHNSYTQERRAMERIWKQREKQLEKVLLNTNHFIGAVQGIAGNSIAGLNLIGASDNILED